MASYVPEELLADILHRLSLKTLFRCRCVCRSWYSLITKPPFFKNHLCTRKVEKQVIVSVRRHFPDVGTKHRFSIHKDNENFDMLSNINSPFLCSEISRIITCCNGLICMLVNPDNDMYLWNPVILSLFRVPLPPVAFERSFIMNTWRTVGFGFIPEYNDYMIVNIYVQARYASVYKLSTKSWKGAKNSTEFFSQYTVSDDAKQCIVNDAIHWAGIGLNKNHTILTFDMKKDEFWALQVPSTVKEDSYHVSAMLFQDSLALMQVTKQNISIWVMNEYGDSDSWTKHCTITDLYVHDSLLIRDNGDALLSRYPGQGTADHLISYDPKTEKFKTYGKHAVFADYFVESPALFDSKF